MISNSSVAPVVNALVKELPHQGLDAASELITRLFNKLQLYEKLSFN